MTCNQEFHDLLSFWNKHIITSIQSFTEYIFQHSLFIGFYWAQKIQCLNTPSMEAIQQEKSGLNNTLTVEVSDVSL